MHSDCFSYTINRFIFARGVCLHHWSIEMLHVATCFCLHFGLSNVLVVFVQNFDTKRENALSWEILSLNYCGLFIDIKTKGKVFWK